MTKQELAQMIDHTNLSAIATKEDIELLCKQAEEYGFKSVCVNPIWVSLATTILQNSKTEICTVIGFPLGAITTEEKVLETKQVIIQGADEIDMVIDLGSLKENLVNNVYNDIYEVVKAAKYVGRSLNKNIIVKVIIETCYLTDEEIKIACNCAKKANADFVKTSTGFGKPGLDANNNPIPSGATCKNVELMKSIVKNDMKIKAAGGIKTYQQALDLIKSGADRIGTSSGIEILKDAE